MPTRILVATDLSDAAEEAVRQADAEARVVGGTLAVTHVVPRSHGVHMLFPQLYAAEVSNEPAIMQRAEDAVRASVERIAGRPAGTLEVFVDQGTDYAEIVRRAESWRADLVVVGDTGRSGLARVMLGSVAERVARLAPCAVLVARRHAATGGVLVATDLSDMSLPAIEAGAREARRRGAKLTVMTVVELGLPVTGAEAFGIAAVVPSAETLREVRDAVRKILAQAVEQKGAVADLIVDEGPAATMILRATESFSPELLVIGTRGRTGLARLALGSVAERVARIARTSVLIVRLASDA